MTAKQSRARRVWPLWAAGAGAALAMTTAIGSTQASWTQAIIQNDTNSAQTGTAVVLREVSGANTCLSSSQTTNSSVCSTINKYGGTATPLMPGDSRTVDVTFSNVGGAPASAFTFTPGACSQTPAAGVDVANLCTGNLTVAVSCSDGATFNAGAAWTDLAQTPVAPGSLTAKTHTATLAVNSSWTCRFTVSLSASAPVSAQGVTVSQPLTWTLTK